MWVVVLYTIAVVLYIVYTVVCASFQNAVAVGCFIVLAFWSSITNDQQRRKKLNVFDLVFNLRLRLRVSSKKFFELPSVCWPYASFQTTTESFLDLCCLCAMSEWWGNHDESWGQHVCSKATYSLPTRGHTIMMVQTKKSNCFPGSVRASAWWRQWDGIFRTKQPLRDEDALQHTSTALPDGEHSRGWPLPERITCLLLMVRIAWLMMLYKNQGVYDENVL